MTARARLRAQGLGERRPRDAHDAVAGALAIQAQDTRSSRLGVRTRSEGLTSADVVYACSRERSLVRTWVMRGTLHLLAAEDVRWLLGLVGPSVERRHGKRRADLGLVPALAERVLEAIPAILADRGPLVRAELMDALLARGLPVDTSDQQPAHIVLLAAARRIVCRGPDRPDEEPTYVLLDDWVPRERERERDAALAELARRYRAAYGPSDAADLRYWSGLPAGEARRAWQLAGLPPAPPDDPGPAPVRLLPAFDGYLLGHRDRSPVLDPRQAAGLLSGSWILPGVVVDGRVVGTWRRSRAGGRDTVSVRPFGRLPRGSTAGLRAEAADVGRFLGAEGTLTVERS